jgi:hypothetical protein
MRYFHKGNFSFVIQVQLTSYWFSPIDETSISPLAVCHLLCPSKFPKKFVRASSSIYKLLFLYIVLIFKLRHSLQTNAPKILIVRRDLSKPRKCLPFSLATTTGRTQTSSTILTILTEVVNHILMSKFLQFSP